MGLRKCTIFSFYLDLKTQQGVTSKLVNRALRNTLRGQKIVWLRMKPNIQKEQADQPDIF